MVSPLPYLPASTAIIRNLLSKIFNHNRNTDRGVDIIQVRLGQAPSEKAAIDVALSIMIRDIIGDLLSMIPHPQIPLSNSIPDGSLGHGHPHPPILEDSNPMDAKARSGLLSMPHTHVDYLHHNSSLRTRKSRPS